MRRALSPVLAVLLGAALPSIATVARGEPASPRPASSAPHAKAPLPLVTGNGASGTAPLAAPPASSYAPLTIPMAQLPNDTAWRPAMASDDWYSGYARARVPVVRVVPGAAFRVSGPGEGAFVFDALIGARLGLTPGRSQLGLFPEAGYGYNKANGEHQLTLGLGLGFGELPWWGYTAFMPRFVLDPGDGKGFRLGIVTQVVETGLSLELGVQHVYRDVGPSVSDLRFALGIDLFLLGSVVGDSRAWRDAARP